MCQVEDFSSIDILPHYRYGITHELKAWHQGYLPIKGGTVLDVGAGCGETALFYLLHGAKQVLAIESDPNAYAMLRRNFRGDPRVIPIQAFVTDIKVDIEGAEDGLTVEWHGWRREEVVARSTPFNNVRTSRFHVEYAPHKFSFGDPTWHLRRARDRLLAMVRPG